MPHVHVAIWRKFGSPRAWRCPREALINTLKIDTGLSDYRAPSITPSLISFRIGVRLVGHVKHAARVVLLETGEQLLMKLLVLEPSSVYDGAPDFAPHQASQLWERQHAPTHCCVAEAQVFKLDEVLKKG